MSPLSKLSNSDATLVTPTPDVSRTRRERRVKASPSTTEVATFDPLVPTVFHEAWWLNAASDGNFQEVTVSSSGRTVGRLPFLLRRLPGLRTLCGVPELTHFLGPAIDDGSGAACNRAVKRAQITRELLDQIPRSSAFRQKMHAGVPDMLVFQERAYEVSVQFTYEIAAATEPVLWSNMRDKTRNVIRRAQEQMQVSNLTDPQEFVSVYNANLASRAQTNTYGDATVIRLFTEASRRDQGRIYAARGPNGELVAAIFCIWDARVSYYLMSTRTPECGNGVVSLLVWEAIRDSATRGLLFDFAGVGAYGSVHFFNGFGGNVTPRYIASRYTLAHRTIDRVVTTLKRRTEQNFY